MPDNSHRFQPFVIIRLYNFIPIFFPRQSIAYIRSPRRLSVSRHAHHERFETHRQLFPNTVLSHLRSCFDAARVATQQTGTCMQFRQLSRSFFSSQKRVNRLRFHRCCLQAVKFLKCGSCDNCTISEIAASQSRQARKKYCASTRPVHHLDYVMRDSGYWHNTGANHCTNAVGQALASIVNSSFGTSCRVFLTTLL